MIAARLDKMNISKKDDVFSSKPTVEPIILKPVGIVRSEIKEPMLRAGDDGLTRPVRMQQEKGDFQTLIIWF